MDVANKGVDTLKKMDDFIWGRVDGQHNEVAKPPDDLISSASLEAAMKSMKGAKAIQFQPLPGFAGFDYVVTYLSNLIIFYRVIKCKLLFFKPL